MTPEERELKRLGDWLTMQSRLEPPPPRGPGRPRKYKRPSKAQAEHARKQALVHALIASRRAR